MLGMHDVIVVGGGLIGSSIAREVSGRGHSVLVLDKGEAIEAASWAAAGMLAPQSEAEFPGPFFELCNASHRLYGEWAQSLQDKSGVDVEYLKSGLLFVAPTDDAFKTAQRRFLWQREHGLRLEILGPVEATQLEPSLSLPVAGAFLMPDEHQVTPRQLTRALRAACTSSRIEIRQQIIVNEIVHASGKVKGVRAGGELIEAGSVVLAAGAWTSQIEGPKPRIPVSPRKGQILSLVAPTAAFRRMIRWGHTYAVSRPNGELVIGATNEDTGFDRSLTPSGVGRLLSAAQELSSAIGGWPIKEMWAGLRPSTPDGLPVIGRGEVDGLIFATGHYRNGVLLTPITALVTADLLEGAAPRINLEAFSPKRFL